MLERIPELLYFSDAVGLASLKEPCLVRARALLSRLKSSLIGRTRIGRYATQTSDTTSKKLAQARETISRKNEELEKERRIREDPPPDGEEGSGACKVTGNF